MSIKTLSPHYISIPLTSPLTGVVCGSYEVRIYIWEGSKIAVPAEPAYAMTKINASGTSGSDKINIARIANDFIEFSCTQQNQTIIVDGNNQVWVKYECYYDDLPTVPALQAVDLAVKGYGYFTEGENPTLPPDKILITGDEFKVSRNSRFVLPFIVDEPTVPERTLVINSFTKSNGNKYTLSATANFPYSEILVFVRSVGSLEWTPVEISGASYIVPESIASNVFEVRAAAFDPVTSVIIYSGTYTTTALKIYRIQPSSDNSGHTIAVYFNSNITATDYTLQIYGLSGSSWQNTFTYPTSPLPQSFTPTGDFKARVTANGLYSNEVSFHIALNEEIIIP